MKDDPKLSTSFRNYNAIFHFKDPQIPVRKHLKYLYLKFLYIKVKIEKITCEKIEVNQTSIANRLNHSSSNVLKLNYN